MSISALEGGAVFAGDYRVVRPLSAGGMGAVYVALQKSTGKLRALKLMHPQLAASDEARRRFEQEAQIGARIESEHIVEVQAAGVDAATNAPFLVMELLEGEDLARIVARRGALTPAEVATVFDQLGHAMRAAHAAGIVHRDLKPENVFLARAHRAGSAFTLKVLDFGIAKLVAEGGGLSTAAIGSPMWLAPEQTERVPVTPATDVWAIGLLAYFLLVGKSYWRAANVATPSVANLLREILVDPLDPATTRAKEHERELPADFDAWFERCVARDAASRFHDAGEACAELMKILPAPSTTLPTSLVVFTAPGTAKPDPFAATEASGGLDGTPAPTTTPTATRPRRRIVEGAIGLVVLAIVGFFVVRSRHHDDAVAAPSPRPSATVEPPPVVLSDSAEQLAPLTSLAPASTSERAPPPRGKADVIGVNPSQSSGATSTKGACDCPPGDPMCTCAETKPSAAEPRESRLGEAQKLAGAGDLDGAKRVLLPRIESKKATRAERTFLAGVCAQLRDRACLDQLQKTGGPGAGQ